MKVDEEALAYFSDRNVLEQIDEVHRFLDQAVRLCVPPLMSGIEQSLRRLAEQHPRWRWVKEEKSMCFMALQAEEPIGLLPAGGRIEFAWEKSEVASNGLPTAPWIGVRSEAAAPHDQIYNTLQDCLADARDDQRRWGYSYWAYLDFWPEPTEHGYVSLHSLLVKNGEELVTRITDIIEEILKRIDNAKSNTI